MKNIFKKFFKKEKEVIKQTYTLQQLMKLNLIVEMFKDDDTKLYGEIIKILGNIKLTKKEGDIIVKNFMEILQEKPDFILQFEHEGIQYGFIPNLDQMSVGEYIDLDTYMKEGTNGANKIMAILYRPITYQLGDYYEIEKYEGTDKYSKVMLDVPYHIYLSSLVFFYHLSKALLNYSLTSIQLAEKKIVK